MRDVLADADPGAAGKPLAVYVGAQAQRRSGGTIVAWRDQRRTPAASGLP